jgi:intracellular sulfur oxidation DsrE/DsrF family protein
MKLTAYIAQAVRLHTLILVGFAMPALAESPAKIQTEPDVLKHAQSSDQIRIDVPVVLKQAKVVFNMDHAVFSGDIPTGLKHMTMMLERFKLTGTKSSLVAVFHGNAGYMVLNDASYNAARKTKTGNPYKVMIENLLKQGVLIEECAFTMQANGWGNENLLPGVKVNSGALGRIVQLVQDGYVMIQP